MLFTLVSVDYWTLNVSESIIIVQLCPILPPLPLVLVVISRRTGHRASETNEVRLESMEYKTRIQVTA